MPSGLAAIAVVDMALLKAGDEVLIPDNAYGPSKDFARHELAGWGIAHRFYDPMIRRRSRPRSASALASSGSKRRAR